MSSNDDRYIILEQYRIYSDAKEKFIDRQFATNRFYLIFNLVLLVTAYVMSVLAPQFQPVIILCVIGIAASAMWWMNIDSYQLLIKVKYANVLEFLETKLPEQPYHKEFADYAQIKNQKGIVVFGDFQKGLALILIIVYLAILGSNIFSALKYQMI